jgi:hypothetical protein
MEALIWIILSTLTAVGTALLASNLQKRALREAIRQGLAAGRNLEEIMREQGYF